MNHADPYPADHRDPRNPQDSQASSNPRVSKTEAYSNPLDSPDSPETDEPDTVATPEGDNEYRPGQPLKPAPDGLQRTPAIDTNTV